VDLNESVIALVGPNEAGKSSILAAIGSVGSAPGQLRRHPADTDAFDLGHRIHQRQAIHGFPAWAIRRDRIPASTSRCCNSAKAKAAPSSNAPRSCAGSPPATACRRSQGPEPASGCCIPCRRSASSGVSSRLGYREQVDEQGERDDPLDGAADLVAGLTGLSTARQARPRAFRSVVIMASVAASRAMMTRTAAVSGQPHYRQVTVGEVLGPPRGGRRVCGQRAAPLPRRWRTAARRQDPCRRGHPPSYRPTAPLRRCRSA
jgi:hypothetical protein